MPHPSAARSDRPDPEALLRHVQAEERAALRGQLKIFLGYASGVGKSFRMFDEARRRRERGEDVVVAAVQRDMPAAVQDLAARIESVGAAPESAIDVAAILARRPAVCVVDGLACDNPPDSRHARRFQDVEDLLAAGISVLTSLNLEYIEEQQAFVRQITGQSPRDRVPQVFIDAADEVVIVDAPPDSCAQPAGEPAIDPVARAWQLSQLRERALLLTADVVDRQLESYLERHGIRSTWGTQERILVCMTPRANAATMLESGRRNAERFHGELFAVYVNQPNLLPEDRSALARNVMLARAQHAHVATLDGSNPIRAILDYARTHGITQLFVGHTLKTSWRARLTGSLLDRLIAEADGMDVRVFPH